MLLRILRPNSLLYETIFCIFSELYDLSRLSLIVLDEADTLLDDSFSQMTVNIIQKLKVGFSLRIKDFLWEKLMYILMLLELAKIKIVLADW